MSYKTVLSRVTMNCSTKEIRTENFFYNDKTKYAANITHHTNAFGYSLVNADSSKEMYIPSNVIGGVYICKEEKVLEIWCKPDDVEKNIQAFNDLF